MFMVFGSPLMPPMDVSIHSSLMLTYASEISSSFIHPNPHIFFAYPNLRPRLRKSSGMRQVSVFKRIRANRTMPCSRPRFLASDFLAHPAQG